ncbi:hypothetical protein [Methylobacterium sp. CM6257]
MDENDPGRDSDPLWYDQAEVDLPPGPLLSGLAYLFPFIAAAIVAGFRFYRLPDRLWCAASLRIRRRYSERTDRP